MFWWAAIFRTSLPMFDKMPHLSKTQCSSVSSWRSQNFREAVCDLVTVTVHLQDALTKFHRPGVHEADLRVHVSSASTCTLALHEFQRCCTVRAQDNQLPILLHWSLVAIPSQAPPTSAINLDSPELKQTMFCFLEEAYTRYHVSSTEPQTAIPG